MVSKRIINLHYLIDFSIIIGTLLGVAGTYWDIQHHIIIGRESFWIGPHLVVYSGILLAFLGSLIGLYYAKTIKNKKLSKSFFLATLTIFIATTLQLLFGLIDDIWHRIFGIDVTIWSPPHIGLLIAGSLIGLAFIYTHRLYMHISKIDKTKNLTFEELKLESVFAITLIGLNIFIAEFEFFKYIPLYKVIPLDHPALQRSGWLYISILIFISFFIFILAKSVTKKKWIATRITFIYLIIRALINFILLDNEALPIIPLTLLLPALILDLFLNISLRRKIIVSIFASIVFYLVHIPYLNNFGINIPINFTAIVAVLLASISGSILGHFIGNKILKKVKKVKID